MYKYMTKDKYIRLTNLYHFDEADTMNTKIAFTSLVFYLWATIFGLK